MRNPFIEKRGASIMGYALVVGLISVVALTAVGQTGESGNALFSDVASTLEGVSGSSVVAAPSASASASVPGVMTSCADHLAAGANSDGNYTIDPDGSGGNPGFAVTCDMTTDGGGWTLFATLDQVPAGGGEAPPSASYLALHTGTDGVTDGGVKLGNMPSGTTPRLELQGTDISGGGSFTANITAPVSGSGWVPSAGAAFNNLDFDSFEAGLSSNASASGSFVMRLNSTASGYPYGGNGADTLLAIAQVGGANTLTLGTRSFSYDGGPACATWVSNAIYWIPFQTGPGGYNCKNTMEAGSISGCNNQCGTSQIQMTRLRAWYR